MRFMADISLPASLAAWGTPGFADALKHELERHGAAALPLQRALARSSAVAGDDIEVMIIGAGGDARSIRAHVGVFYSGIVAGCSCADDPTPVGPENEYCELVVTIDRLTADATAEVVPG
jgi:hypothetical protein